MPLNFLRDVTEHIHKLGNIDIVKVTGTDTDTVIDAMSGDRSVIVQAKTYTPIPELIGQFGMPQMGKLNTILGISEYNADAKVTVTKQTRNGVEVLDGVHFENKNGDFKNDYRFMSSELINEQLKTIKFKGVAWDVEFTPMVQNIMRLKAMANANSDEATFVAKTENNSLKFYFGDHSSHSGDFVFASGVTGKLSKGWHWPVSVIQSILDLPGDKTFRFSDEGVAQIVVDSGLINYVYLIPAQQK